MKFQLTSIIVLLHVGAAVSSESITFFPKEEYQPYAICNLGTLEEKESHPVPCSEMDVVSDNCIKKDGWLDLEEPYHTPEDQRKCLCDSDYWKLWKGCDDCYRLHGDPNGIKDQDVDNFSSAYCDDGPVTMEYISFYNLRFPTASAFVTPTSVSNVLGTQTAISLYYTEEFAPMTTVAPTVATTSATTATASTTTGAAPALRQDSSLLTPVAGLMVAMGLLA